MHRTAAVCKSGLLYMWGYGRWRQLGQEDGNSRNVPVRVDINPAIKQVAIGGEQRSNKHRCAVLRILPSLLCTQCACREHGAVCTA